VATATIRDGDSRRVAADLVVDGGITAAKLRHANRLSGTAFTILDSRIAGARAKRLQRPRSKPAPRVLIALGGGSYVFSVVPELVRKINRLCPQAQIDIAAGFSGTRGRPRVERARWIRRRSGLSRDLAACDVAVVGGGLTLYEACAIGAPAVGLAVVPAQRRAIAAFAARAAIFDAGSWTEGQVAIRRAAEAVASCLRDRAAANRRAHRARRLVDGYGAARVAACIQKLVRASRGGDTSHG
jgi:spore coat polysaccharide biosynthesis predicted glycosyltransferase SpsG